MTLSSTPRDAQFARSAPPTTAAGHRPKVKGGPAAWRWLLRGRDPLGRRLVILRRSAGIRPLRAADFLGAATHDGRATGHNGPHTPTLPARVAERDAGRGSGDPKPTNRRS